MFRKPVHDVAVVAGDAQLTTLTVANDVLLRKSILLAEINAVKTRMFAYCISGLSAAICGILVASRLSSAQPTAGNGYEMEAIAASVLGGISILGGEGTILNTIIGALMMGVIRNGLNLNGINSFWQQVIVGLILLIAVASQTANKGGNLDVIKRFFGLTKKA